MHQIAKKLVVDEDGNPQEVIIGWQDFVDIQEILGLDLDAAAQEDLRVARGDRESGSEDAYVDLSAI